MNFTAKTQSKRNLDGDKQIVQEFQLNSLNYTFKKQTIASKEIKMETVISTGSNKHYTQLTQKEEKNSSSDEERSRQVESGKKQIEQKGQSLHSHNKKQKKPTMKVKCNPCGKQQFVSAKRTQFRCQSCGQKSKCNALYGVLTCLSCTKRVLYMKGVASMIRCTNCSTINIVSQSKKMEQNQQYEQ